MANLPSFHRGTGRVRHRSLADALPAFPKFIRWQSERFENGCELHVRGFPGLRPRASLNTAMGERTVMSVGRPVQTIERHTATL